MPERLRARRDGIDKMLQHVLAGVITGDHVNLDRDELRVLLDALPVAVLVSKDRACSQIWGNAAACALYGLPRGTNFSRTAPPDELPPFEIYADGKPANLHDLPLQRAAMTGEAVAKSECEIRFRRGGSIFIAGHCIPLRNNVGEVCGSIGAFLDLTPQRKEFELSQIAMREMSHRLKNTLAIVQAISRKTLRPLLNPAAYEAYEDRLISLARYQDLLHQQNWSRATISQIVDVAVGGVSAQAMARISADGPDVNLSGNDALTLSMILHELSTNAIKYGSLSNGVGSVVITWATQHCGDAQEVCIQWRELDGPPVASPSAAGFGTSMMTSVARGLPDGQLDLHFEPSGLCAALRFLT